MFNQFCRSFAGSTLADIKISLLIVDVELLAPMIRICDIDAFKAIPHLVGSGTQED
jgi:hypothetical protein